VSAPGVGAATALGAKIKQTVRKLDLSFCMAARRMIFREFFAIRAATGLEIQAQIEPTRSFHTVCKKSAPPSHLNSISHL
jgi:hypothetical protein